MTSKPAITAPAPVTVIGLGNMGVPMASRLSQAGFQVTGFDLSDAARQRYAAAGGKIAKDAADELLIFGFFEEVLSKLDNEPLHDALRDLIKENIKQPLAAAGKKQTA